MLYAKPIIQIMQEPSVIDNSQKKMPTHKTRRLFSLAHFPNIPHGT